MVNISGIASLSFVARATIGARHVGTRREIVANETYQLVRGWSVSGSREKLLAHEGAERLRRALKSAPRCDNSIECMRGVRMPSADAPTWERLGPPQPGPSLRDGRYNTQEGVVLYLASTHEGVAREFKWNIGDVWVQQYVIPGDELRVADFSPPACSDEFLNTVFWWAETAGETGCPAPAAFSQTVAEIVRDEFDGMLVPGIRGDDGHRYRNVIMFQPCRSWRAWGIKDLKPILLSQVAAQIG